MATQVPAICTQCGQPEGEGATCSLCGASLLIDLHAVAAPERARYLAGRGLAELGPPLPTMAEVRARLDRPGARVVGPVSRAWARRALEVAVGAGLEFEVRPAQPPSASRALRPAFVVALLAAVGALVGVQVYRARIAADPQPEAELEPAESAAPVGAAPPPALTTPKIGKAALDSVVALECPHSKGAGFFIDRETLVTNAHVLCADGANLKVRLHDGRELIGITIEKNTEQDWAKVNVLGAAAPPLPIGDPLALEPGDRVVLIGSPHGLAFTLHEGEVSYIGRNIFGVGYLQLNATINPGNSGGPLLDSQGRVVGIVSLKMLDVEGIGMALPISYVAPPSDPERLKRWSEMLAQVATEDAKEVDNVRSGANRPLLVGVADEGRVALVLEHSRQTPGTVDLPLELADSAGHSCPVSTRVEQWLPLVEALQSAAESPRLRWLLNHAAGDEMFVGGGRVDVADCLRHPGFTEPEGRLVQKSDGETRGSARVQFAALRGGPPLRR